jgi:hypothetical protein
MAGSVKEELVVTKGVDVKEGLVVTKGVDVKGVGD